VVEIRGSRELGGSPGESPKFGCLKLREEKSRSVEVSHKRHMAEPQGGPGRWTDGHTSHIWRNQHPVDLSRLGDSGEKGTKVGPLNSRRHERQKCKF
jgi:hypothetical protein